MEMKGLFDPLSMPSMLLELMRKRRPASLGVRETVIVDTEVDAGILLRFDVQRSPSIEAPASGFSLRDIEERLALADAFLRKMSALINAAIYYGSVDATGDAPKQYLTRTGGGVFIINRNVIDRLRMDPSVSSLPFSIEKAPPIVEFRITSFSLSNPLTFKAKLVIKSDAAELDSDRSSRSTEDSGRIDKWLSRAKKLAQIIFLCSMAIASLKSTAVEAEPAGRITQCVAEDSAGGEALGFYSVAYSQLTDIFRRQFGNATSTDQIKAVQTALAHLGYYVGKIDGDAGPTTMRAFGQFAIDITYFGAAPEIDYPNLIKITDPVLLNRLAEKSAEHTLSKKDD